jgi:hypothetical protein
MDGEIVIDRGDNNILKLDDDEQAMMDEIRLEIPSKKPTRARAPPVRGAPPPQPEYQEDIDSFANPNKQSEPIPPRPEDPIDYGEYDNEPEYEGGMGGMGMGMEEEVPSPGYSSIDEEKADLVNKLGRLEKKGFAINKRLNVYSPVDDLRSEVKRITYSIDVDKSVKFSRRMLIACVTGLEFLNKRYNPFEIQLEGWSENVMENVDDYDEVFEELYVKYRTKMHVAPEVKLIMMLGGSAMMFHLTNSMFKSVMPNVNDVMKQNPGLMQNMMSAVQNTMSSQGAASPPAPATGGDGRHEMQGPGFDISSLMGNIMMPPPPPMNTTPQVQDTPQQDMVTPPPIDEEDSVSDIVSVVMSEDDLGDVKDIKLPVVKKGAKKGRKSKKNAVEINV